MKYIQRYKFRETVNDKFELYGDYMGSAEFENGSVGSAQDLLCATASRMSYIGDLSLKDFSGGKINSLPMMFVTLDHVFSNGVSYAAYAATDIIVTIKDKSLRFKENPRFDKMTTDIEYDKPQLIAGLPNVWLNLGGCVHSPNYTMTTEEYRKKHIEEIELIIKQQSRDPEFSHLYKMNPIWLLAPQPYAATILKLFGAHDVKFPETVDISNLRMFDRVMFLDSQGNRREARVVGLPEKGVYLQRDGGSDKFKIHERQIVEILPYVKKQA